MTNFTPLVFRAGHADVIDLRPHERATLDVGLLEFLAEKGFCNTMMADGRVIFLSGYYPKWRGTIQVYIIPSIYVAQYAKSFVKKVREYLDAIAISDPDLKRMETCSLADEQTDRWMAILGFRCEGTHPQWAKDGSTYRTWACRVENGKRTHFEVE